MPLGPRVTPSDARLFQVLNLQGRENLTQSVAWDGAGGAGGFAYMAKAVDHDTVIQEFSVATKDSKGRWVATRELEQRRVDAGHGSQIFVLRGVDGVPRVGSPWDTRSGSKVTQRSIATLAMAPGTFKKSQARILDVGTNNYSVMAIDIDHGRCVLRITEGSEEFFVVREFDHLTQEVGAVLNPGYQFREKVRGTFQGVTLSDETVYAVYGETTGKAQWAANKPDPVQLYTMDWKAKKWSRVNVTGVWRQKGDALMMSEPESVNMIRVNGHLAVVVAFKCGSGDDGDPDEREIRLISVSKIEESVMRTGYGWTAGPDPAAWGGNATIKCGPASFRMRKSLDKDGSDTILADLWRYVIWTLNGIEPAAEGRINDEWSYYFKRNTNDPNSYSQHAGAQALDWNAMQHPNGSYKNAGFTAQQVSKIRLMLAFLEGVVYWGNDYKRTIDPMHFEIAPGTSSDSGHAKIKRIVEKKIRPLFKDDPVKYGLPGNAVKPPVMQPPTDIKPPAKPQITINGKKYDDIDYVDISVLNEYRENKKFSRNIWYLQTWLKKAGFDPKGADGYWGPGTQAAYDAWRKKNGFQTGAAGLGSVSALAKAVGATKPVKEK